MAEFLNRKLGGDLGDSGNEVGLGVGEGLWLPPGFTPVNFSGLSGWYISDRSVTLTSGNVSTWGDLSRLAHDLTDGGVSTRRPTPIAGGLAGRQTVRFNGTSNWLQAAFASVQPIDIFIVMHMVTVGLPGSNDVVFDGATGATALFNENNSATPTEIFAGAATVTSPTPFAQSGFAQGEIVFNGAACAVYSGAAGTQILSGNAGAASPGGFTLGGEPGGTRFTNIEVAEVILYSQIRTRAESAIIRAYLTREWGV